MRWDVFVDNLSVIRSGLRKGEIGLLDKRANSSLIYCKVLNFYSALFNFVLL